MNATTPEFADLLAAETCSNLANVTMAELRVAVLSDAGKAVAAMAGCQAQGDDFDATDLLALIRDADPDLRELAHNLCADLVAVMEPGLATLLALQARGADCQPAAMALRQEFIATYAALVALLTPERGAESRPPTCSGA